MARKKTFRQQRHTGGIGEFAESRKLPSQTVPIIRLSSQLRKYRALHRMEFQCLLQPSGSAEGV